MFIIRNVDRGYILLAIQLKVEKHQCPLKLFRQFNQRMYSVCKASPCLPITFISISHMNKDLLETAKSKQETKTKSKLSADTDASSDHLGSAKSHAYFIKTVLGFFSLVGSKISVIS